MGQSCAIVQQECLCVILLIVTIFVWSYRQCPKPENNQPYNADNANEEYAKDYGGCSATESIADQDVDMDIW